MVGLARALRPTTRYTNARISPFATTIEAGSCSVLYARYVTAIGAVGDSGGGLTGALAAASPSSRLAELRDAAPAPDGLVDRRR